MKKLDKQQKEEKLRQEFQRFVDITGRLPGTFAGYEVARDFKISPGGAYYEQFRAWEREQLDAMRGPYLEVPVEMVDKIQNSINDHGATLLNDVVGLIGSSTGALSHALQLQLRDAEARVLTAYKETDQVAELLTQTEVERDDALATAERVNGKNADLEAEVIELRAQIKARDALFEAFRNDLISGKQLIPTNPATELSNGVHTSDEEPKQANGVACEEKSSNAQPEQTQSTMHDDRPSASEPDHPADSPGSIAERQEGDGGQTAGFVMDNTAPPSGVASGTGTAEPEAAPAEGFKFDNRPSESEPDHLAGDHRELPLDSTNSNPNGEEQ